MQNKKNIICRRLASVVAQVLPTVRINGIYCLTTNQAISAALHRPSSTAHHAHTTAVASTGKQQRALKRGHNMYCATTNFRLAGTGTEVSRSSSIAVKRSTQATTDSRRGILPVSFAASKVAFHWGWNHRYRRKRSEEHVLRITLLWNRPTLQIHPVYF